MSNSLFVNIFVWFLLISNFFIWWYLYRAFGHVERLFWHIEQLAESNLKICHQIRELKPKE